MYILSGIPERSIILINSALYMARSKNTGQIPYSQRRQLASMSAQRYQKEEQPSQRQSKVRQQWSIRKVLRKKILYRAMRAANKAKRISQKCLYPFGSISNRIPSSPDYELIDLLADTGFSKQDIAKQWLQDLMDNEVTQIGSLIDLQARDDATKAYMQDCLSFADSDYQWLPHTVNRYIVWPNFWLEIIPANLQDM